MIYLSSKPDIDISAGARDAAVSQVAKLFTNGRSQAVRLPADFLSEKDRELNGLAANLFVVRMRPQRVATRVVP